ncbi:MAG: sulfoxide reductase heme-binding subunit YedZ [Rhodospirillales bacterium]|jgi:methionine sulfoxide reductase heme-binding subunit|nr:sulfoxide reductase heme-binding subunit YedZ [Rhodospirillales bacterium]
MNREKLIRRVAKPAVFALCLGPIAWYAWLAVSGGLGANPIEATTRYFGDWGLRFMLVALAVTPLREAFGLGVLARFRRMTGLFAFFYVSLHLTSYVALDQFFDMAAVWADIIKRNFITIGMISFAMLVPLAITSTSGWMKRLGGKSWQRLHRLVYPAGILAVVHFYMMVKADVREPLIYAAILTALLAWRIFKRLKPKIIVPGLRRLRGQ